MGVADEPIIDPDRFLPADHDRWPGHWSIPPTPWPEDALETAEAARVIRAAMAALPEAQRAVITVCTEYLVQMRKTIARLGTLDETTLSRDTRERLVAAFSEWRG